MISCCLSDGDGEYLDFCAITTPRARTRHVCVECDDGIKPGDTYERIRSLYDGDWDTAKTCPTCLAVRREHNCGDGYLVGDLWSQLAECYGAEVIHGDWTDDDEDPMGPPP